MKRKKIGILLVAMVTVLFSLSVAIGADYPSKPINFLIPFGAGGAADVMGRTLAAGAEKVIGQPFVPINRPGAGGGIMYTALKASKANGYTVGWNSTSILTSTNIGNVPFKYSAFDNICRIGFTAMPIAVLSSSPWKTYKEFVEYAKKNPSKIKIGNAGTGSGTHLTAVLLEKEAGVKVVHVPLGGKRRVPSLLGGEVEAICVPLPEVAPQVKAGKARILVMPSNKRDPGYPDVPTAKELGYPVAIDLFRGISLPKGTPDAALKKLEDAFMKGADDANFQKVAKTKGFNISLMGRTEFEKYLVEQNKLIADAMKIGGLVK